MNLFGHIIAEDQVIGISPLHGDSQFVFYIYLKGYTVGVQSEHFTISTGNRREEFKERYEKLRNEIDKMISSRNVRGVEIPGIEVK